ncbi:MFS transporter [Bradyrhizobium sp. 180]|uniref:MFS transporter n=1 Tax=unclassified Bradyrhizobium TaxID=2631580 RepID=UPI001FF9A7B8|nr:MULTISPECIES: MFS transporter [unclassified Bradyrhizobium]MCK1494049.1 MFS transporter [Bradyrhizobium sp. 180]MCK1532156.1 MFS transporter [Bradyrhizobium sp. 182]MCK1594491.1 MFS transporter [Bradyrhizobium sp. 164]MCK1618110.1 MFS transporter [Bradyrhizobium sp. 159]MCK1665446.1 MFS transporter [Bradyrhizobium sp. 153]
MSAQGTPSAASKPTATPKGAWTITFLLFLFMLVNFADKIVVGLAGVPIMADLKLTPEQFGLLGSSFFFLFSISAIVVGFIVNKVPTRWVLLSLAVVWALAQFPMVGTVSFTTLLICRIVLGAGEGPAFSVAAHAIYKWFPDEKRTLPTAILSQGSAFGVIIAVPALNWIIVNHSWHYAFGALGVVGLVWVCAWLALGKEGPLEDAQALAATETKIPYIQLLTSRTFLGCVAATFGAYWALSLGLTWFTPFIIKGLGFSQSQAGWISTLPWIFGATIVILTGWISQMMMARGSTTRIARGVLGSVPLVVGGLILATMPHVQGAGLQLALLVVGTGLCGAIYVVCPPMLGEFTPTSQRGAILAIYGALYTLSGIIAPAVMGTVIQHAGSMLDGYMTGFTINAAIMVGSGLLGLLLLWPNTERARLTGGAAPQAGALKSAVSPT